MSANDIIVRWLGMREYLSCWEAMRDFTNRRDPQTFDEIWLLEHPAVFTQGQNGKAEHILHAGDIPVIKTDRGGQVTYHGPGQLMAYTLVNLQRKKYTVRDFVSLLENSVIGLLADYGITATTQCKAPGVYINDDKISSIGLRVRRGCAFHGLALNVSMDLTPFSRINPCGFSQLKMTQLAAFGITDSVKEVGMKLSHRLLQKLNGTASCKLNHPT